MKHYFFLMIISTAVHGQQQLLLDQASMNLYVLNPAAAGLREEPTLNSYYKKAWTGIPNSPELLQVTADGRLMKGKQGAGIVLRNERAGIFNTSTFGLSFRHRLTLSRAGTLSMGVSAGFSRRFSDFSNVRAASPEEFRDRYASQASTAPVLDAGILYCNRQLAIGITGGQILQSDYTFYGRAPDYKMISGNVRHFTFSISRMPAPNDKSRLYPMLVIRSTQGLPLQAEAAIIYSHRNKIFAGAGYRTISTVYLHAGFSLNSRLRIIYTYEYGLSTNVYTGAGHEVGLLFRFKDDVTQRHQDPFTGIVLEEIQQKSDEQQQRLDELTRENDSLNKNLVALKSELELLKNQQVSQEDIAGNLPSSAIIRHESEIISREKQKEENTQATKQNKNTSTSQKIFYQLVLGVYQLPYYAKEYRKFLKRELQLESRLLELPGDDRVFIYVCTLPVFSSLKDAVDHMEVIRETISSSGIQATRGEPWLLRISK